MRRPSLRDRRGGPFKGRRTCFPASKARFEGKVVWGRQAVAGTEGCGSIALNCAIQRYNKDLGKEGSKIKCASDMAPPLPEPEGKANFMADSWQPRAGTVDSCLENGWRA
ncbi:MAG: hypothetical protein LBU32_22755 [Clostridiales bacterium]|nr:hypothetical protein [Clostridiales bacterium]